MAITKVSALTEITSTVGTEELLINDGGTSKKIQVSNLPDTDTNTNQLTTFTVSASTDTTPTTISQGDDLMFTAGTGITCETTADGTVTISNTVTDTDTTYSTATTSTEGLVKIEDGTTQTIAANTATATASRTYGVQLNGTGQAVVNVPWVDTDTDTDTTYSTATATTEGLVKIEDDTAQTVAANTVTATASRTYGVQLNASDQAVVNVPWTDTDTGITDVVDDTTPQLGGNLDLNGNNITGTGAIPAANITGTISGVNFKDVGLTTNAIGSIGGGTQDIDLTLGNSVSGTVDTSTTTFTFSNPTASDELCIFSIVLTNGGSQTVNFPASVDWEGGTAPTLTAAGVDILIFATVDGGTIWHGQSYSLDSKTPS